MAIQNKIKLKPHIMNKNFITQVNQAIEKQSIVELISINQIEYRERLYEYFSRINRNFDGFDSNLMHDINGLKYNDNHFVTRL